MITIRFLVPTLLLLLTLSSYAIPKTSYYAQSIAGHLGLMRQTERIDKILAHRELPRQLREGLTTVLKLRFFASEELGLPENDSYLSYADIGRDYVVWNVYATPELSLVPLRSCFPVAGCVTYRGFFSKDDAQSYAHDLRRLGYDVTVTGATGYSTLKWFDDPVLSTMLNGGEERLVKVILHELAHQKLYVKDDTAFNEAFANTVAREGAARWFAAKGVDVEDNALGRERSKSFIKLVLDTRKRLDNLYRSRVSNARKRTAKAALFAQFQDAYRDWKKRWNGFDGYDEWVLGGINNAKIASIVTYHDLERAFDAILDESEHNLPKFYNIVSRLGRLPRHRRAMCLETIVRDGGHALYGCLRA